MMQKSLGDLLVQNGALSGSDLEELGVAAEGDAQALAETLMSRDLVDEGTVCAALAQHLEHPALALAESIIDLRPLAQVPQDLAYSNLLLPVAFDAQSITVACVSPEDRAALDQIAYATGRRVTPLVAVAAILKEAIPAAYGFFNDGQTHLRGRAVHPGTPDQVHLAVMRPSVAMQMLEEIPDDPPEVSQDNAGAGALDAGGSLEMPRPPTSVSVTEELDDALVLDEVVDDANDPTGPFLLVVEDDSDIRGLIQRILTHDGHQVHAVSNGTDALALLRRVRPQLVLLDAMLPGVHGFEICSHIKNSMTLNNVPVLMISAVYRGLENSREIQETHGADAFIEKPFEIPYLRKKVAEFLGVAIAADKPDPDAHNRLVKLKQDAHAAYQAGDLSRASGLLAEWIAADPFDPVAYFFLGNLHNKSEDLEEAMKAYERAITFNPELFGAVKNLAVIYEKLGFISRSRQTWRRARDLTPDEEKKAQITERLEKRFK
jgi:CheY-like chemotaxis protein